MCYALTVILALCLFQTICQAQNTTGKCNSTITDNSSLYEIARYLSDSCRYDRSVRPTGDDGSPVNVSARMYIFSLQVKSTEDLQFLAHLMIQFRWRDPRLSYSNLTKLSELVGGSIFLDSIWIPHIFLSNEKKTMGSTGLVHILPQGDVLYVSRIKTSFKCTLKTGHFPFDHQTCVLHLDTWRYNSKHLVLQWESSKPIQMTEDIHSITEYSLLDMNTTTSEFFFTDHVRFSHSGVRCTNQDAVDFDSAYCEVYSYSSLSLSMTLAREFGFYFFDYYLPSVLVVMTSWFTFWVDPEIVPARVWLACSTMLAFFALGAINDNIPKISTFKTQDIWFVGCTIFILVSLIEFAFVNIVHRQELKKIQLKKPTSKYILKSSLKSERTPWKEQRHKLRRSSSCPSSPEVRKRMKQVAVSAKRLMREEKALSGLDLATPLKRLKSMRRTQIRISETPVEPVEMTNHEMANWIDKRSRAIFPIAFLVFNFFYWSIMLI